MELSTTYICVKDMKKSLQFWRAFLQEEPVYQNGDRWVSFRCGISLYNKAFDEKILSDANRFNMAYIEEFNRDKGTPRNNVVVLNFQTQNLKLENERMKNLHIGSVSEMMYVNVYMPYWYFNVIDPDGNTLEITGEFD